MPRRSARRWSRPARGPRTRRLVARHIHARRPTAFVLRHDVLSIFAGHYDPSFPIALYLKDLGLVDELTVETGACAAISVSAL